MRRRGLNFVGGNGDRKSRGRGGDGRGGAGEGGRGGRGGGRRNGRQQVPQGLTNGSLWPADDLYIKVITAMGEVMGLLALQYGREKEWLSGTQFFCESYKLLNIALTMADTIFVNMTTRAELGDNDLVVCIARAHNKCNAINIASTHGIDKRDRFAAEAQKRKVKLEAELAPQWESRDEVKAKIGEDKWTNNPAPKGTYADKRKAAEAELRAVNNAMELLTSVAYEQVRERSEQMMRTL